MGDNACLSQRLLSSQHFSRRICHFTAVQLDECFCPILLRLAGVVTLCRLIRKPPARRRTNSLCSAITSEFPSTRTRPALIECRSCSRESSLGLSVTEGCSSRGRACRS